MKNLSRRSERGVVLVTTLLILLVMLIGAVALVRSLDTSLVTAGNLAFKRDLAQQSELAAETLLRDFRAGGPLATRAARSADNLGRRFSAAVLPSNTQGIPIALLTDPRPAIVGEIDAGRGITLHYVVDRQCSEGGDDSVLGGERCTLVGGSGPTGGSSSQWQRAEQSSGVAAGGAGAGLAGAAPQYVAYRISIRATGPRGTQSFFQTTFACCDQ